MQLFKGKSRRAVFFTAIACAVAVLGVRLWLAWVYHVDVNPDGAIVHLMVRHVMEGRDWPVFFYGQAYMGSFEPLVSALVAKIFGFSLFAVCCGTALFGAATVICTAFWAWMVADRRAGAITLALLLIGLQPYIHYFASPRGGYGALLFFTMSTLALGAHLLEREIRGAPRNALWFLALGIGAGIGFWSNFLTLPAIATVGLSFLLWRGLRAFRIRIIASALAGFALGSLPMWIWNIRNGWATMNMSDSVGFSIFGAIESLLLLIGPRLRELLSVDKGFSMPIVIVVIVIHILLIPAALLILINRNQRKGIASDAVMDHEICFLKMHVGVAALWLVLFVLCFIASPQYARFNTPRYLLPMVPVIAWMAGVGASRSQWKAIRITTLACAALSLTWQLYLIPNSLAFNRKHKPGIAAFEQLGDRLESLGASTVYASYIDYIVNPLHGDTVICSDPRLERYAPFAHQIEMDSAPSVIDNYGGIGAWALSSGGQVKTDSVPGHTIYYDLRPPSTPLAEVPLDEATFAYDDGEPLEDARYLFDRRRITMLRDTHPDSVPETIIVTFPQPVAVSAVRLWGVATPPVKWEVAVRDSPESDFRELASQAGHTDFFWSGPRFFWAGPQQRHEIRFPQVTAREFRLRFKKSRNRPHIAIAEIQFLRDAPECGETINPDIDDLISQLNIRGVSRLYADRWIANQVYERTGGTIWTSRAHRGMLGNDDSQDPSADLTLVPGTAILAPLCAIPSLRDSLAARRIEYAEEALPGFGTLFFPCPVTMKDGSSPHAGIRFAGAYALCVLSPRWAESCVTEMGADTPLEILRGLYADVQTSEIILHAYTNALINAGETNEVSNVTKQIAELESLRTGGPATFFSDLKWLGALAEPTSVKRGEFFTLRSAWCGNLRRLSRYIVFVHLVGPNGVRFQGDHGLDIFYTLDDDDPFEESMPFFDCLEIRVPYDIPPGKYDLNIGIYPMNGGARVKPKTERQTHRNAIVIKDILEVTP